MENFILSVFKNESNARAALQQLKELDQLGDIVLYNLALIKKQTDGQLQVISSELGNDPEDLPANGAVAGSLIGLLAGPLGMAIGMMTGVLVGAASEQDTDDTISWALDKASEQLVPGDFAIVLDVEEDTPAITDSYLSPLEAVSTRIAITHAYNAYDAEQWEAMNQAIDAEEQALHTAADKDKAAISAKIETLKKKRATQKEALQQRALKTQKQLEYKADVIHQKVLQSKAGAKEKLEQVHTSLHQALEKNKAAVRLAFS